MMSLEIYSLLFFTGAVAGTVDAIAGGGGLITLPVLLGIGIPPHIALGTNKLQSCCGTSVATYHYYRHGWLDKNKLLVGLLISFIGAVIGAITAQLIHGDILKKIIPYLLFIVLLYSLFSPKLGKIPHIAKMKENTFYIIFGLCLGFYDGFLGPGTGAFWTFALMYFLGLSITNATAYTKAYNLNTNVAALICFIVTNNINYPIAICMAAGQIIGSRIGAKLAIRKGANFIRPVFLTMVFVTIVCLVFKK